MPGSAAQTQGGRRTVSAQRASSSPVTDPGYYWNGPAWEGPTRPVKKKA